jgi:glycosyltransferase involved in cell wall biosynthesis
LNNTQKHIVWLLANCSSAPYFNWFAKIAADNSDVKMSFVCLYHEKPQMIEDMKPLGFDCYWVKYDYQHRKSGLINSTFKLFSLFRKLKPDIIHTHLFDDSLAGMVAGKFARVPQRMVTKGDTAFHFMHTPKWMFFDKIVNRFATKIIAISSESQQFILEKEKATSKKVILINHGIPTALYQNPSQAFMDEFKVTYQLQNKFVVGTVSRFIEWKGYKNIVRVAELVVPKIPNVCFLLIGKGEQKQEIIELIKTKGLENHFCMPGYIQPENMPSVYGTMHAFLHAAIMEPFGFVIAEALAAGLPVVSMPTGAAKDAIKHGENGWLAEYNKPEQLADYLINIHQKNLALPWKNAQETAEKMYDVQLMYSNYMNTYQLYKKEGKA